MTEDLPRLELMIQEVQSYLYKIIHAPMEDAGFKFSRYNFSFARKHEKNFQEFGFIFINQSPVNHRINFILQIINKHVKEIKSSFFHRLERKDFMPSSIIILLQDFGEDGSCSSLKDFVVTSYKDLFIAAESISKILQYEAVPLCDLLSTLNDLDSFYTGRGGWSVDNFNLDNIISELIIARLNAKRDLHELYHQIMEDIETSKKRPDHDAVKIIELCYDYLRTRH